jgi:dolichyl-phosphate-mannose-protein mannosyltransferase
VTARDRVGVRLGPILSDLLIAVVLFAVISGRRDRASGCAAAALYLFNPGTIANSALWNYDSIPSLLILATVVLAGLAFERGQGRWLVAASCFAALALATKLQAVMILPALGLLCLLYGSWRNLLFCAMAFLGITAVAYGPWLLAGRFDYPHKVFVLSFQDYPVTHVNSFNLWGLWFQMPVTTRIMGITAESWGRLGLIVTLVVVTVPLVLRRRSLLAGARGYSTVALVSAYVCFAAFMVLTRMHERYVAPAVALMILAAFLDKRLMFAAVGLGITYTLNLACIYFNFFKPWNASPDPTYYEQAWYLTLVFSRFLCSALNLAILGWLTVNVAKLTSEST